jgi:hypothetical protein
MSAMPDRVKGFDSDPTVRRPRDRARSRADSTIRPSRPLMIATGGQPGRVAELFEHLETVGGPQPEIEQDQIACVGHIERHVAAIPGDAVAHRHEALGEFPCQRRVVLDDEDT